MPVFEYACNQCAHQFEVLLRSSQSTVDCPQCQSADLRKLLSAFSATVASANASANSCPPQGCGNCCGAPGQCMMN